MNSTFTLLKPPVPTKKVFTAAELDQNEACSEAPSGIYMAVGPNVMPNVRFVVNGNQTLVINLGARIIKPFLEQDFQNTKFELCPDETIQITFSSTDKK